MATAAVITIGRSRHSAVRYREHLSLVALKANHKLLVARPILSRHAPGGHAALHANLDEARNRFHALSDDRQVEFRPALDGYLRVYAFLSQVAPFADGSLERACAYEAC
jgi:hypothetical protein